MSESQKTLIQKYFWALVEEFITDPAHKNITVIFQNHIESDGSGDTLGQTEQYTHPGLEHWTVTPNGTEVPGSRWKEPDKYTYTVRFLNYYPDEERWRGTVAHEFAHLWLYSTKGKHEHDDLFYSQMDSFEDWLDKKWNLAPRKNKEGDWNQHIDFAKREQRKHRTSQFHNHSSAPALNEKEIVEYNRLFNLLNSSENLSELEQNYQKVKKNPLYSSSKRKTSNWWKNVGEELDDCYNDKKNFHNLINLMENVKSSSQLKQIYQTARNNPLYAKHKTKALLDQKYIDLMNNLSASNNHSEKNKLNNLPWNPLLIGGVVMVIICLIIILFLLLIPAKEKKPFSKVKKY